MYFNKDTYSLHYEKYGEGKEKLLILPGWGDTRKTFDLMIYALKELYTVYIIDYPGFGLSIFPDNDLTIYDYTNIIRDFMESENIENPIVIAHSFGGRIASILSGYYKENIKKLVLIDSAGIKPRKNILKIIKTYTYKLLKWIRYLLPRRKRNIYLKKLLNIFGSSDYKALDKKMYTTFKNIVNHDLKYCFKNINCPTLLIWGEKDKDTKLRDGKLMNKYIKDSKLVTFPDAGHFSYLNYPAKTNQLLIDFIEKEKKTY